MLDDCDNRLATVAASWKRWMALYRNWLLVSREIARFIGLEAANAIRTRQSAAPARAALFGRTPSAIMRSRTPLAASRLLASIAIVSLVPVSSPGPRAAALVDSAGLATDSTGSAAGAERWLPEPEEDLENPEALEEDRPGTRAGVLVRASVTRGSVRMRRIGLAAGSHGLAADVGFLFDEDRVRPGARIATGNGRAAVSAGRVSVSRAPPLFADAMRLTRTTRRVPAPRWGGWSAAPSLGASPGAIDGAAVTWRGAAALWSFAGIRGGSREAIGGIGLGIERGRSRAAVTLGAAATASAPEGAARCGSITFVRRERGGSVALEALGGSRGRAFLAEVTALEEAILFSARWRYRSWEAGRVAGELAAETSGTEPRIRMTWRSWSASAAGDDGLLELEAGGSPRGATPVKVRLGAAGLGFGPGRFRAREAYGLIDATVARGGGRSLGVHALRRASAAAASTASSTTVGAELRAGAGGIGEHSLLIESTRVRRGAPAWGIALSPSGEVTLRSRSKPGMWFTARGGFGTRRARLGYTLERGEDAEGPKPWSGAVWVRLNSE